MNRSYCNDVSISTKFYLWNGTQYTVMQCVNEHFVISNKIKKSGKQLINWIKSMTTITGINMSVDNFSTVDAFVSDQSSTGNDYYTNSNMNMTMLSSTIVNSIIATSVEVLSTTVSPSPEPQSILYKYLRFLCEMMTVYFTPVITIAGTVGNVLSVMVFFCTKLKKLSSSYYLGFLAFFDTGFLWCNFIQWLGILGIHLYNSDGFCQIFTWLSNACSVLSVWFVVAFTMERFVAVMYPLKRPTLCTVSRIDSLNKYNS